MTALYLDSSAFVKIVVDERESSALRAFLETQDASVVSSALLRAEALRAVRDLGPEVLALVREGLRRVDLVGLDDRVLDTAGMLAPDVLRTLDAIHLATAIQVGDDLQAIVTYDARMIDAAGRLGLKTVTPS